jgi:3-hydroxybutyrate dehydrogenase
MDKKQTAVITGSNSGIGLGIAHALAAEGHNVVINSYTNDDEDHELAREIAQQHGNATVYIQADMSRRRSPTRWRNMAWTATR